MLVVSVASVRLVKSRGVISAKLGRGDEELTAAHRARFACMKRHNMYLVALLISGPAALLWEVLLKWDL